MDAYKEQDPHPIPKEAKEYLKSLDPRRQELHKLATKMLGSSYFVERTIGFQAWKDGQKK